MGSWGFFFLRFLLNERAQVFRFTATAAGTVAFRVLDRYRVTVCMCSMWSTGIVSYDIHIHFGALKLRCSLASHHARLAPSYAVPVTALQRKYVSARSGVPL